jgi:hypothetical protein
LRPSGNTPSRLDAEEDSMASLLEVLVAFISVILLLAFAAQAVQEIVKYTFAIKGFTRLSAVEQLIVEASRERGLTTSDGEEIVGEVLARLRALGQKGFRKRKLRLDYIDRCDLGRLIRGVKAVDVSALRGLGDGEAGKRLDEIAREVEQWFHLAVEPVTDRYRRRMRFASLVSALAVVLALNANAFAILERAIEDPELREQVASASVRVASADSVVTVFLDSLALASRDTTLATRVPEFVEQLDSARSRRDSTLRVALTAVDVFDTGPDGRQWGRVEWWIGIALSTLLVSMGAPFWHDVLEAIFGLKIRARGNSRETSDGGDRREAGE